MEFLKEDKISKLGCLSKCNGITPIIINMEDVAHELVKYVVSDRFLLVEIKIINKILDGMEDMLNTNTTTLATTDRDRVVTDISMLRVDLYQKKCSRGDL